MKQQEHEDRGLMSHTMSNLRKDLHSSCGSLTISLELEHQRRQSGNVDALNNLSVASSAPNTTIGVCSVRQQDDFHLAETNNKRFISPRRVRRELGISEGAMRHLLSSGQIKTIPWGRRQRIDRLFLRQWLAAGAPTTDAVQTAPKTTEAA